MAISYVGGVQGGRAGATGTTTQSLSGTLTGGSDASPQTGDLVVVLCAAGADTTAPASQTISGNTSGAYSNEAMQSQLGTTYDAYAQLNWQFMGGTPDTTLTIPSSGSIRNAQRWVVHVFRGVDSSTPWDVASAVATGTGSGRPNPPSITPSTAGAWILWLGASAAATGAAYTAPTDFATDWLGGTTADTADVMMGAGYYTGWASGAYDPAAITAGGTTGANDSWVAKTAVLKPAPNAYTLTCAAAAYTLTGVAATILKSKVVAAAAASFTLSGVSANILKTRIVAADAAAFTMSGVAALLSRSYNIGAEPAAFAIAAPDAALLRSKRVVADAAAFAISGVDATITYTPAVTGYTITAEPAAFSLSGQNATLTYGRVLAAEPAAFVLSGVAATILKSKVVTAAPASLTLAANEATISYSGAPPVSSSDYVVGTRRRRRT